MLRISTRHLRQPGGVATSKRLREKIELEEAGEENLIKKAQRVQIVGKKKRCELGWARAFV